jgi:hypothetical protein
MLAQSIKRKAITMVSHQFTDVLELFESYGWKLQRIYEPYRVFVKQGELPWLVPVHDKKVDVEYVKKFKEFLKERGEI